MLYLGIDGGGSRTRFLLVNEGNDEVFRGEAGPSNWNSVGQAAARTAIATGIAQLPATPDVACGGFAGAGRTEGAAFYESCLRDLLPNTRILIETDAMVAYAGALGIAPGVLLIAGTGSIAIGRRTDGTMIRAGGWGPQFGDEGSGFWIGREAIRAALRARDSGTFAEFRNSITATLGLADIADAVTAWSSGTLQAPQVATLAREVIARYPVEPARHILEEAAGHLRQLVRVASGKIDVPGAPCSVVGSVGENERMRTLIGLEFKPALQPPERGAILLARSRLEV